MNTIQTQRFNRLRKIVAEEITRQLAIDCFCKSYEGTWELTVSYPNYFEDETATEKPDFYKITLHCYVIGPGRHYGWCGKSWDECLNKCELDIDRWCKAEEERGGEGD